MDNGQQIKVKSPSPSFPELSNRWQTLNVWSRAAALGSLWAAFEIVVGSFLHNLRVPLHIVAQNSGVNYHLRSGPYKRV